MIEIKELTKIQYEILSRMDDDYYYPFKDFDDLCLTRKQLSKEFKVLKEAGLVSFVHGGLTEEGIAGGSGYTISEKKKVMELIEGYERQMRDEIYN